MPDEITREEQFLSAIAGESVDTPEPITREEMFLAKIAGGDVETPEPVTRKEKYYQEIIDNGGGGGGGSSVLINKNINANGTYNASSDNADGYKKVVVDVPNPSTGTLSITANDTYDVTDYASVDVDVPIGITPSGTKSITANGTYDVTAYESADVDVPSGWTSDGIAQNLEPNGAITLSNAVTEIKDNAFMLKPITSISGLNVTKVGGDAFNHTQLASVSFPSLVEIGNAGFRQTKLVSVDFPNVTTVGTSAFQANTNTLVSASFSNWATATGTNVFYDCEKLTDVDVPKLTTIKSGTFQQCYSLEYIDLPAVTKIENNAFNNARKLATLVLRSNSVVTLDNVGAFTNTPLRGYNSLTGTIYVPSSLVSSYQTTATNWSTMYSAGYCTFSAIEGSAYE